MNNDKKIAIIGLGYVGLPLAIAFSKKFKVVGFDIDPSRIDELNKGHDSTLEVSDNFLSATKDNTNYSSNINDTKDCNVYIVVCYVQNEFLPQTITQLIDGNIIKVKIYF